MTDDYLLKIYHIGWYDCARGENNIHDYDTKLEVRAYKLGWDHYIIGDEITFVDGLSGEEIIDRIRN